MRLWFNFFLKGLLVVAPISISIYCIVMIVMFIEKLILQWLSQLVDINFHFPGLGIVLAIVLITFVGIVMHTLVAQKLYGILQQLIAKLPILKTIYFAIEDFMSFFADQTADSTNKKVVLVNLAEDLTVIGIVTNENPENVVDESVSGKIAVYLPMSYQIGGYTVFVERSCLRETELSVEDGMKLSMTAWMKKTP